MKRTHLHFAISAGDETIYSSANGLNAYFDARDAMIGYTPLPESCTLCESSGEYMRCHNVSGNPYQCTIHPTHDPGSESDLAGTHTHHGG